MATTTLATWAAGLDPASIPPKVHYQAQRALFNYIGCAIHGAAHPAARRAHAALQPFFGLPTSSILGWRAAAAAAGEEYADADADGDAASAAAAGRADAQHAALLGGLAAHVDDYDDTHLETIVHPSAPIAAALFAALEACGRPVAGALAVAAFVAGVEAACKLALAVAPAHYDAGWHVTATVGAVGAAVAVGRVMGLDADGMRCAIALAAVQVTGLRVVFGSESKAFQVGRAAQNGLLAAVLAGEGFGGGEGVLEGRRGWIEVVGGGQDRDVAVARLERLLKGLGDVWETEKIAFKPFPCGVVAHPVIDACVQVHCEVKGLADAQNASLEQALKKLRSVKATVHPLVLELTGKKKPQSGLDAKFSVFHGAAVGLLYGKAGVKEFADETVSDPDVIAIRDKIDAEVGEGIAPYEAIVEMQFEGGAEMKKHVEHALGSLAVPVTDAQLKQKFIDQTAKLLGKEEASKASLLCWGITEVDDVASILRQL